MTQGTALNLGEASVFKANTDLAYSKLGKKNLYLDVLVVEEGLSGRRDIEPRLSKLASAGVPQLVTKSIGLDSWSGIERDRSSLFMSTFVEDIKEMTIEFIFLLITMCVYRKLMPDSGF